MSEQGVTFDLPPGGGGGPVDRPCCCHPPPTPPAPFILLDSAAVNSTSCEDRQTGKTNKEAHFLIINFTGSGTQETLIRIIVKMLNIGPDNRSISYSNII